MGASELYECLHSISTHPDFYEKIITSAKIEEVLMLVERIAKRRAQREWSFQGSSGWRYRVPFSPDWLRWAVRYRWNQTPLMRAIRTFREITGELLEIQDEVEGIQGQR